MKKYVDSERLHELIREFLSCNPFFQEMDAAVKRNYLLPTTLKPRLRAVWAAALEDMDKIYIFLGMDADLVRVFRRMWTERRRQLSRWGEGTAYLLAAVYLLSLYSYPSVDKRMEGLFGLVRRYLRVYWAPADMKRLRQAASYRKREMQNRVWGLFDSAHGLWDCGKYGEVTRGITDLQEEFADELRYYMG